MPDILSIALAAVILAVGFPVMILAGIYLVGQLKGRRK